MVSITNPMADIEDNIPDEARAYIAILERQVLGLTITVNKQGAIIESLSGKPYEDAIKDLESKEIHKLAVQTAAERLGVSKSEAARIVRSREV